MAKALHQTIKQLLELTPQEIEHTYSENAKLARQQLSAIASAANKRMKRIEEAGLFGISALEMKFEDRYSIKDVESPQDASSLLSKMKEFFEAKTTTVKGAREFEKHLPDWYKKQPLEVKKDFWKAYRKYTESEKGRIYGSDDILLNIETLNIDALVTVDDILKELETRGDSGDFLPNRKMKKKPTPIFSAEEFDEPEEVPRDIIENIFERSPLV